MTLDPAAVTARIAELRASSTGGLTPRAQNEERTADMLEALMAENSRLTSEVTHWRAAHQTAMDAGKILKAEVDQMRPVVEWAERWRDTYHDDDEGVDAVDAYRTRKEVT